MPDTLEAEKPGIPADSQKLEIPESVSDKKVELPGKIPEDENIKFPNLANGTAVFYDDEKFQVWIGIPLDKLVSTPVVPAAINLVAQVDRAKAEVLVHLHNYACFIIAREQQKRSPIIQKVNANLEEVFKDLKQKGKSLLGR